MEVQLVLPKTDELVPITVNPWSQVSHAKRLVQDVLAERHSRPVKDSQIRLFHNGIELKTNRTLND